MLWLEYLGATISINRGCWSPRPRLNIIGIFPCIGISIIKIGRSRDRLIFIMRIPVLVPVPQTIFRKIWGALVQTFVVIGRVHFKPEHCKCWSSFEFDRNIVSGTGAWSEHFFWWHGPLAPCVAQSQASIKSGLCTTTGNVIATRFMYLRSLNVEIR